jgi:hypothetical protein
MDLKWQDFKYDQEMYYYYSVGNHIFQTLAKMASGLK